jgi:hypothetical protein
VILRENRWFDIADNDQAEKNAVIKDLENRRDNFSSRTVDLYSQNREEEVALVANNLQALDRLIRAIKAGQGKLPEESMKDYLTRMVASYKAYIRELMAYVVAVHTARERGQAIRVVNLVNVKGFPIYVPPGGSLYAKRPRPSGSEKDWEAEFEAEDRLADEEDKKFFEEKRQAEQQQKQEEMPKVPGTPADADAGTKKQKSASPGEGNLDVDAMIAVIAGALKDPQFYKSGADASLDAQVKDFMRFVRANYTAPIDAKVSGISLEGICGHCCSSGSHVTKRCPSCKHAYYCSKECYHKDWNDHHKHNCKNHGHKHH